jgi:ribosomal protein L14E/L6E/L27E
MALAKGTECIILRGRDSGKKVSIIGKEGNFVIIEGKNVKKRRSNPRHLLPVSAHGKN